LECANFEAIDIQGLVGAAHPTVKIFATLESIIRLFTDFGAIENARRYTMENNLNKVINKIGEDYKENIRGDSRFYLEVSIARMAEELGFADIKECYKDAYAIVPLRKPVGGMTVRIDGRTFVNYSQFDSGVVVPTYVASQVDLPRRTYTAQDSMICNYSN
jgi:hypothetical protein